MACSCPSNLDMSAFGTQYWGAGCAGPFLGPTSQFVIIHVQDRDFLEIYCGEARVTSCLRKDGFAFWIVSFQFSRNHIC